MTEHLSKLAEKIRRSALEERRTVDDFDRMLKAVGLFDQLSEINLSVIGPWNIGLHQANFFRLNDTNEADQRLKEAIKFCGLCENEPRHWRALLNALLAECFPKKGRNKTRDEQGLFGLLLDIHELQGKNPKLIKAEEIARQLLRSKEFVAKYPSLKEISSLTRLVRKAQDPNHNPYTKYREDKNIALSVLRQQYPPTETGQDESPVFAIASALSIQRVQEDALLEIFKRKHFESKGSACDWEAEQRYRKIAIAALGHA